MAKLLISLQNNLLMYHLVKTIVYHIMRRLYNWRIGWRLRQCESKGISYNHNYQAITANIALASWVMYHPQQQLTVITFYQDTVVQKIAKISSASR